MLPIIALTLAATALAGVGHYLLPKVIQQATLNKLHDLRNQIHEDARHIPELRDTHFFRDVEWLLCVQIHIVRSGRTSVAWHAAHPEAPNPEVVAALLRQYQSERDEVFEQVEGGVEVYERIPAVISHARTQMAVYGVAGRPYVAALILLAAPVVLLWRAAEAVMADRVVAPIGAMARDIAAASRVDSAALRVAV